MDKQAYKIYLSSKHWAVKREERLKYDQYKCLFCGSGDNLNVHHLSYEHLWCENVEEELVTLCRDCHKRLHDFVDIHIQEVTDLNKKWREEADAALTEIAEKHRKESGIHLALMISQFLGEGKNKNIARIIKVFRTGLGYKAGYTMAYPARAKENTYTIAARCLSEIRKKEKARD